MEIIQKVTYMTYLCLGAYFVKKKKTNYKLPFSYTVLVLYL